MNIKQKEEYEISVSRKELNMLKGLALHYANSGSDGQSPSLAKYSDDLVKQIEKLVCE